MPLVGKLATTVSKPPRCSEVLQVNCKHVVNKTFGACLHVHLHKLRITKQNTPTADYHATRHASDRHLTCLTAVQQINS